MPRERKLISLKEAADYLGFHPSTMYRMLRTGEISAIKIRTSWYFEYEKLDAWVAAQPRGRTDISRNPHKKSP